MNAGCAGKTVRSLENACRSALTVCSREGAVQIHVYVTLYLTLLDLDFVIKAKNYWRDVWQSQVAMHRNCHLLWLLSYFSLLCYCVFFVIFILFFLVFLRAVVSALASLSCPQLLTVVLYLLIAANKD